MLFVSPHAGDGYVPRKKEGARYITVRRLKKVSREAQALKAAQLDPMLPLSASGASLLHELMHRMPVTAEDHKPCDPGVADRRVGRRGKKRDAAAGGGTRVDRGASWSYVCVCVCVCVRVLWATVHCLCLPLVLCVATAAALRNSAGSFHVLAHVVRNHVCASCVPL